VKAEGKRVCQVCGAVLGNDGNLCPVCALQGALGNKSAITESQVEPTHSVSQLRFEHYEVLTCDDGTPLELGRGAMGVTYKALDVNLRYAVALKVINARFIGDESARRRFVREARAAASVRHPNVASVFHLGKSGDSYFYAMEFVDGESLDKVIRRSSRLDPSTALRVTALVAAGLEAIDQQNLVHRDIKPSNIMVRMLGDNIANAKIIDLGLAKGTVADDGSISEISIQGAFAGTPAYAGPEQFAGVGANIRSDLYSLGITLWEMLAGEVPFKGSTSRLIYQHQHATPPVDKLTRVPQPVIVLVEILLEKDPDRRLQTPTELLQVIPKVTEALESGRRVTADQLRSAADRVEAKPKQFTRGLHPLLTGARMRALGWLLASVLGMGGLLLAWFLFSGHGGPFFSHRSLEATPAEKSIAVLPFENISANKDDAYFADGVQDEILNNLAKVAQLKVISRTSVMQYRAENKRDLRQIASALGVANVLEGTVRRDRNRIRVSTELIDARNDHTIWADSYDRNLTDIFAIQGEIAQTIAHKLTATFSPGEKESIEAKLTDNLEAYDLYLRAKELIVNAKLSALANIKKPCLDAISFLEQAIQIDPKFTLAACASAEAHDMIYYYCEPTPERRALGDAAVDRALQLQPDLPEVHLASATHLYRCYRDYGRARVQLAIAMRDLPNNAEARVLEASIDRRQGNFEKAIEELNEASRLDPRNPTTISALTDAFYSVRRFSALEEVFNRLIDRVPDNPIVRVSKEFSITYLRTGNCATVLSAIAALPASMAGNRRVLTLRLNLELADQDWVQANRALEQLNGSEADFFAYANAPVPVGCYSLLFARLRGESADLNTSFAETRELLNQMSLSAPDNALLLSELAVVDALLARKEHAIKEAKSAVERLPISEDAVEGPAALADLATVYAWTGEPAMAFEQLKILTKIPCGVYYGQLKNYWPWTPLRGDPRFEKLLAELAPRD
jgi:serine/threonine protein kinase/tetratricopeptide (TPR) repeat protein